MREEGRERQRQIQSVAASPLVSSVLIKPGSLPAIWDPGIKGKGEQVPSFFWLTGHLAVTLAPSG